MKTPKIFISHQWRYDYEFRALREKMDQLDWYHNDYLLPAHNPYDLKRMREIEVVLKQQIQQCNLFIVFARMAAVNSEWVEREVQCARECGTYILGVKPFGYIGNIPHFIQEACAEYGEIVGFSTPEIIRRIEAALAD